MRGARLRHSQEIDENELPRVNNRLSRTADNFERTIVDVGIGYGCHMNSRWNDSSNIQLFLSRRAFLSQTAGGLGLASLAQLSGIREHVLAATP